jgi:hypothetical protein
MLLTLEDVRSYTQNIAKKFPAMASEIVLNREPLLIPEDVVRLLKLPGSYVEVVEAYRVEGVSIGFFALWPSFKRDGLIGSLMRENDRTSLVKAASSELVAVGRNEANILCVGAAPSNGEGRVFLLDTMTSPARRLLELANAFGPFVILAANLHQISDLYDGEPEEAEREMVARCNSLGCTLPQIDYWKSRAAEMTC